MRRLLALGGCAIGLAAPAAAQADGLSLVPRRGGEGVSVRGAGVSYLARGGRHDTVVTRVRRDGGTVTRSEPIRGRFGVAPIGFDGSSTGLAADGRTLVLAGMPGRHYPPRRTQLLVMDAPRLRVRARIVLRGYYTLDAISPSGRWLYLIHYTSFAASRYEVRAYDLRARRLLRKPVVDPREPDEAMRGVPITRAVSPDGRWAYTLYDRMKGAPFLHALDTARRTAVCVDLPGVPGGDPELRLELARRTLAVVRRGRPLAMVDVRTRKVTPPAAPARSAATIDDGASFPWAVLPLAGVAALAAVALARRRLRGAP